MQNKTFKVLPNDAVVDMQISAVFMSRIQSLVQYLVGVYGSDKFTEFAKYMMEENGTPRTDLEHHLLTLTGLMTDYEMKADEQGKTKELTVEELNKLSNEN